MSNASEERTLPFDLTPTEEQQMICDSMKRFAEAALRPAARHADASSQIPDALLDEAHGLGITLLAVPEQYGGAGTERSPISNVLIAEQLARGDMALALAILSPLGVANTILDQGSAAQRERYLPRFVGDTFYPAATAVHETSVLFDPMALKTRARKDGDDYVIDGEKTLVALSTRSPLLLVLAQVEDEGPAAFLVEGDSEGVTFDAEPSMGLRGMEPGRVTFANVRVPASARLGENERSFDVQRFLALSKLGLGAAAVGVADGLLEHVIEYTNTRVAFGEPISHRQAVAFMVANIGIELEGMRLMVLRAASRAEQGLDFVREAVLAARFCGEHAMEIGSNGVQLLGGHGFTQEHYEEMWYRHLRAVAIVEGLFSV